MTPRRSAAFAAACWCVPSASWAHAPIEGLGDFYGGLLHPFFEPAHVLCLVALGLLLAQQLLLEQRATHRTSVDLGVFIASLTAGLSAAGFLDIGPATETVLLCLGAISGAAVAAAIALPRWLTPIIAAGIGLLLGVDSISQTASPRVSPVMAIGIDVGATLGLVYVLGLASRARRHWQRVGVRVVGSWIAASALLVLSLTLAESGMFGREPETPVATKSGTAARSTNEKVERRDSL